MKNQSEIIILGASLQCVGGVANYYTNLNLHANDNIEYFEINSSTKENPIRKSIRLIANYTRFIKLISTKSVKIIHINPSLDYKSFWRDAIFLWISLIFSKKIIIFFRGWEDRYEKKIKENFYLGFVFKNTYLKADAFVVLGQVFKKKLLDLGASRATPFFIETTIADTGFLSDFDLNKKSNSFDSEVKILFLSRIEIEKGIYIAIDAFHSFCIKNPDKKAKLIIVGSGNEENRAINYTFDRKIRNVEFTGYLRGKDKGILLNECHIMLFPTYYGEGLPNSILEGMLYGMPIITRINAGIPDVIQHNINGYITESKDPVDFSFFLEKLVQNKLVCTEIAKTNHKIALEHYTTEKVRERILSIYDVI